MVLILIRKIVSLFLILFAGAALVRTGVVSAKDSRVLSRISLYLLTPCVILTSFQVERTPQTSDGLLLAAVAAVVLLAAGIGLNRLLRKPLRLDPVEQTAVIYSNAGNLIIPLVSSMLGAEWVIYTSAYIAVQQVLLWTHGKAVLRGESGFDLRKIATNVNIISICAGVVLFFTGLRLPGPIGDAVGSLGGMIGPVCMLVSGMLIGGMRLKKVLSYRRLWLVVALRLVAVPLFTLAILRFGPLAGWIANGRDVLLISFLATVTPSASTLVNMALVYECDADYASAINAATTLLCVVTMPVMVTLYTL